MLKLNEELIEFLKNQNFVIVSTIDKEGYVHSACKGMVEIDPKGEIYILDLYKAATFENLKQNQNISLTSVDENKFKGFCLKGTAKIMHVKDFDEKTFKAWEERINARITQRVIKNILGEKAHKHHPEALLPKPQYLIVMDVKRIIDLTPHQLK